MKKLFRNIGRVLFYIGIVVVILFIVLFIGTMGEYPVPKTLADDLSLPRITVNGRVFHGETFGNASNPVVIVVHGGPGWDYRSLLSLKDLSDAYYVVFYDQRGAGLSPRVDPGELTLESMLEDLDSLVDHFGKGEKVNLVGHSWGGMLVSGYLGKHPEKIGHAVLAEPGFLTTEMMKEAGIRFGPRWEAAFLFRAAKDWFQSLHIKGPDRDAASDYFIGQIAPYANTEYYCNNTITDAGALHWRAGARAMQAILRSAMDKKGDIHIDLVSGVNRFTSPVLILASECNQITGRKHQEKQAKFFPNAKLEIIKGSGHSMFGERPAESISVVRKYLKNR